MIHGEEPFACDGNLFYNKDSTIVLNTFAAYYDVLEDDISLPEYLKHFIYEDESISYKQFDDTAFFLQGKNKEDISFMRKGMYREAYDRKIVVCLELKYKEDKKKEAGHIWNTCIKKFPDKPFE